MSKKIVGLLLALGLTVALGACGGGGDTTAPEASPTPAETPSP